jgi:hypothetical protein
LHSSFTDGVRACAGETECLLFSTLSELSRRAADMAKPTRMTDIVEEVLVSGSPCACWVFLIRLRWAGVDFGAVRWAATSRARHWRIQ